MTQPLRLLPGGVPLEVVRGEPFAVVASFVDAAGDPLPLTGTFAAELLDRDAVPLAGGAMTVAAVGAASLRVEASAAAAALLVDSLHRWRLVDVSSGHTVLDGPVRPRPSGAAGVAAASFEVTAQVAMSEAAVAVSVMTTGSSAGGGGADLSDATPAPLGVASAGTGAKASRDDHVHPMPSAADVGALSASSGFNTAGGWLRLDASGTAPDNTIPSSIARDTEVTAAVAAHTTAVDPHGDRAYADGLAGNYATAAQGAAADTAVQPGDLATVATTGAYGDLSGRPTLGTAAAAATGDFDAAGAATAAVAAIPSDGAAATPSLRTLGTGALQAAAGNDARLSDARTPSAHHASHEDGGSDEVTLAQSQVTGLTADLSGKVPTTRTVAGLDLTADRSAADVRGALGSGTPDSTTYLRGDGQWMPPQPITAQMLVTDPNGSAITTGDGQAFLTVPAAWNGKTIQSIHAGLTTASSSGTPTVQVARIRGGTPVDVLSTAVTVDATELTSYTAVTPPVVDTANDDLATGDLLRVDVDVAGTGAKGLMVLIGIG